MIFLDVETEPLPEDEILRFMPEFHAPSNFRDESKIAAYVDEARREWLAKAALSPLTGRILLACVAVNDAEPEAIEGPEWRIISDITGRMAGAIERGLDVVTFNGRGFDLPFIRHRCLILGQKFPSILIEEWRGRLSFHERIRDVMLMWTLGERGGQASLNNVALALGMEGKTGDWGGQFGRLYRENRAEALRYARRDVELTREIYRRLVAGLVG